MAEPLDGTNAMNGYRNEIGGDARPRGWRSYADVLDGDGRLADEDTRRRRGKRRRPQPPILAGVAHAIGADK